jgi:hypothetical protein
MMKRKTTGAADLRANPSGERSASLFDRFLLKESSILNVHCRHAAPTQQPGLPGYGNQCSVVTDGV